MSEAKAAIAGGWKAVAKALEANMNALLEENRRLRAALEMVEWDGYDEVYQLSECLWCGGFETKGHTLDCARQAALKPEGKR